MHKILLLLFVLVSTSNLAQEVRCNLTVNTTQVSGGSLQLDIVQSFERQVREFINERRWTNDIIKENEKIEFSLLIDIEKSSGSGAFEATAQIQTVRPVYNSAYNSAIFSYKDDKFNFIFTQMDVLNFNIQNSSESNLTAMLAYYVYLVIGYDYATFSPSGGKPYFDLAMNIANQNQNSNYGGWKPLDSEKNRYWIVQNMIQPRYDNLNKCLYMYHRKGLDQMSTKPVEGRKKVTEALQLLEKVYDDVPDLINVQIFFNAKSSEIIGIYKSATPEEKKKIISLLDKVYPTNTQNWSKINER